MPITLREPPCIPIQPMHFHPYQNRSIDEMIRYGLRVHVYFNQRYKKLTIRSNASFHHFSRTEQVKGYTDVVYLKDMEIYGADTLSNGVPLIKGSLFRQNKLHDAAGQETEYLKDYVRLPVSLHFSHIGFFKGYSSQNGFFFDRRMNRLNHLILEIHASGEFFMLMGKIEYDTYISETFKMNNIQRLVSVKEVLP